MNKQFFLCTVALLVAINTVAVSGEVKQIAVPIDKIDRIIQFPSLWYFLPSDAPDYATGNFGTATVYYDNPADWWKKTIPASADYTGTGWYVIPVELGVVDQTIHPAIAVPLSYGAIQFYVNGVLLHESDDFNTEKNALSRPIVVGIPNSVLKTGTNYLAFRIKTGSGVGGFGSNGLETPFITIGPLDELSAQRERFVLQYAAIGFTCIFLFLFFFFHYLLRKKEVYNLYFALFSLATGIFILGYYGFLLFFFPQGWAYWLLTFLGGINMYLMTILFIPAFFNMKKGIVNRIFTGFYIVLNLCIIVEFFLVGEIGFFVKYIYGVFNLSYIILVIYLVVIGIRAVRQKHDYARTMFTGIVLLVLSFVYSMLTFASIIMYTPLVAEGFFVMLLVFSFVLAQRFSRTHTDLELAHGNLVVASDEIRELNRTLEEKVLLRTAELREKNEQITESIEYAALIQNSMLPNEKNIASVLKEHFVIWKPRNIVGGDFYWFYENKDQFLIAVIDCTGHGVPGALLTMTTATALDHIVHQMKKYNPSEIIGQLNNSLKHILNQQEEEQFTDDGLEIGMIGYDKKTGKMIFSGSGLRLLVVQGDEVKEFRGNRGGIGYKRSKIDQVFTAHEIDPQPDAAYYLSTDGYIDQNGGTKDLGLGWNRFQDILKSGPEISMKERKQKLDQFLKEYQGNNPQRDDITVIGFKL